jgi:hypothetical protein
MNRSVRLVSRIPASLRALPVLLLMSCAEGYPDRGGYDLQGTDGGERGIEHTEREAGELGTQAEDKGRGCVYIQWCNDGRGHQVCRMYRGCSYGSSYENWPALEAECRRDRIAVCGYDGSWYGI